MVALGMLDDERIELLHGTLVEMSPNNPPHASPVQALTTLLVPQLAGRAVVRVQLPLVAADDSEPDPDIAVVPLGDYRRKHPRKADLVIEVAVSSVIKDREIKAPLYAASRFPEYWLIDVPARKIEVHRSPRRGVYAKVTRHGQREVLRPQAFADIAIRVADVFG